MNTCEPTDKLPEKYFFQFDLVNGFSIRVLASSFSRAISRFINEYGPDSMKSVKTIYNIDMNAKYN